MIKSALFVSALMVLKSFFKGLLMYTIEAKSKVPDRETVNVDSGIGY